MNENSWIDDKPEIAADKGWVKWHGKTAASPVNAECLIEIRRRDGGIFTGYARGVTWDHHGAHYDAVAYRVTHWIIDPDEIFEHVRGENCPLSPRTEVMAAQGGYEKFTLGPSAAGIYGWAVIDRYKILKGG